VIHLSYAKTLKGQTDPKGRPICLKRKPTLKQGLLEAFTPIVGRGVIRTFDMLGQMKEGIDVNVKRRTRFTKAARVGCLLLCRHPQAQITSRLSFSSNYLFRPNFFSGMVKSKHTGLHTKLPVASGEGPSPACKARA